MTVSSDVSLPFRPVFTRSNLLRMCAAGLLLQLVAVSSRAGSEPAEATQRNSVSYADADGKESIVFRFDKEYQCGRYANGDWWVVADPETKSVVIEQIDPDHTAGRNGWCVNPSAQNAQPFDGRPRLKFDPALIPALPYKANAGDSIVKAVSLPAQVLHSFIKSAAVLTVVDKAPQNPSTTFRPPYAGKFRPEFFTTNLRVDLLPSLSQIPKALTRAGAEARLPYPRLDYLTTWASSDIRPVDAGFSWGAEMSVQDCEVYFWLCLNQPLDQKMKSLIGMVQYGIDLYGAMKALGTNWNHGGGGNGEGRLLPLIFAATMLNSEEIKAEIRNAKTDCFWEIFSFCRGRQDRMVLWGQPMYASEERYWSALAVDPALAKTMTDPYHWIDGGSTPGESYQGCTALPAKYTALVLYLIPELQHAWPEKDIRLFEYVDRWAAKGTHTMPDPVAPAPKLTKEEWAKKEEHGYGKTWGPDPAHPGEAIAGRGRFPERDGTHVNSANFPPNRISAFGEAMWNAFRNKSDGVSASATTSAAK